VNLPASRYDDTARRLEFHNRLLARVGEHAAIATELPPYNGFTFVLHIAGKPVLAQLDRHDVGQRTVSPGYFSVMGTRLLRGRTFDKRDQASSEAVAVINEAIAREYFAESNPIGQHITTGDPGQMTSWRTIVGVVSNEKNSRNYRQIGWIEQGNVFLPLTQNPPRSFYIATRGSAHDLQSAVAAIDPEVAVGDVETMQTRLGRLLAYPRFRASLLGAFAGFSVLLAVIGLYGVLGQFLAQRTPEIGLRIAVGARPLDVLRLIAFRAGRPVLSGLIAGLAVAAALQRYLSSLLYGVEPADPITFGMVCGVLFCAAALAAFLPARRAMRVDPMIALRNE
jgi:predicted permease